MRYILYYLFSDSGGIGEVEVSDTNATSLVLGFMLSGQKQQQIFYPVNTKQNQQNSRNYQFLSLDKFFPFTNTEW